MIISEEIDERFETMVGWVRVMAEYPQSRIVVGNI